MRPKRQVVDHALGYAVTHSDFATHDLTLARSTADELDRVDPLPCPHASGFVDIHSLCEPPGSRTMCIDCSGVRSEDEWEDE